MICSYCGYDFPDELGKYGCANCLGGTMSRVTWEQPSDEHGDDPECVHVWDYTYNEAGECFECGMLKDDYDEQQADS